MQDNPYAPPSAEPSHSVPIDPESLAQRRAHFAAERQVLLVGSVLFASSLLQASVIAKWSHYGALPSLLLLCCTAAVRMASGVLLWQRNPLGRWLHLAAWLVYVIQSITTQVQTGDNLAPITVAILAGLVIFTLLWRSNAKPVFERDYRERVIPATASTIEWGAGFYVAHGLLILAVSWLIVANLG